MLAGLQPRFTSDGHLVKVGGVVALTTMVCVQTALLPQASVALYVRVIVLLQLLVPLLVLSPTKLAVAAPPQLSLAVTEAGLGGGTFATHWTVTPAGQVIDGGVVSLTTM